MTDDEELTARLLRLAGPRAPVPVERAERIRHAVTATWLAQLRRQRRRRRVLAAVVVLATAAAMVIATRITGGRRTEPLPKIDGAVVERVEGASGLSPGRGIAIGEWIETGSDSRAAVRIAARASVRIDVSSRARLLDAAVIELERGAVYIDTGTDSSALEVRTRLGIARDVGTQFEVRLHDDALRVRVRSGLVEVHRPSGTTAVHGGSEVTVAGDRAVTRQLPAFGPEWQWAAQLAAPMDIEGQPLAVFLEHISREQGWTLRFEDAGLTADASRIILHGSVKGLEPEAAVTVAVRTSNLESRIREGELLVSRPKSRD
jgi:ferric-dicitrate binding protein FerR (iron transport regulator)